MMIASLSSSLLAVISVNPVPLLPHAPGRWRSIGAEGCLSLRAVGAGYSTSTEKPSIDFRKSYHAFRHTFLSLSPQLKKVCFKNGIPQVVKTREIVKEITKKRIISKDGHE
jgi:hypothetical protein